MTAAVKVRALLLLAALHAAQGLRAAGVRPLQRPSGALARSGLWRSGSRRSAMEDPAPEHFKRKTAAEEESKPKRSFLGALRPRGMDKGKLAAMGTAALLSYGAVSNLSTSVLVAVAWYTFSAKAGLSPLAPGQWKGFLAVYGGLWVFNNFLRPFRVAAAAAVAPALDRFVGKLQARFGISKPQGFALAVFVINVAGTITFMCGGIALASLLSGVSVFPGAAAA